MNNVVQFKPLAEQPDEVRRRVRQALARRAADEWYDAWLRNLEYWNRMWGLE